MSDEFQRQREVPMAATHCWERWMDTGFCKKAGARSIKSTLFILKTTETALVLFPLLLWGAGDGTEGLVPSRTSALPGELHSSFAMAFEQVNTLESAVRLKKQAEIGMEAEANSGACVS